MNGNKGWKKGGWADLLRPLDGLCWRDRAAERELKSKWGLGKRDMAEQLKLVIEEKPDFAFDIHSQMRRVFNLLNI